VGSSSGEHDAMGDPLPAIDAARWARWTMQRAEDLLRVLAGLQSADVESGTWPPSKRISANLRGRTRSRGEYKLPSADTIRVFADPQPTAMKPQSPAQRVGLETRAFVLLLVIVTLSFGVILLPPSVEPCSGA
jgi:hypothetical protein